jgi:hypothetical protein
MVAGTAKGQDRGDLCGLPGGRGERRASAFERRHALLEDRDRRVRDA